jgi:hypothetical protein
MFWINLKVVPAFGSKELMHDVPNEDDEEIVLRPNLKARLQIGLDKSQGFGKFSIWKIGHYQPELNYCWQYPVLEFKYQIVDDRVLLYVRLDTSEPTVKVEKEYHYEISFMLVPEMVPT